MSTKEDIENFVDSDANAQDLARWNERIELKLKVERILSKIKDNPDYYLSVRNRRILEQWYKDYQVSMEYVA